ncbi:hypothetical protein GW17_00016972 [Ensete ventricosum]|nr:hypothetical protein GW17_00016972 [Ensete ventricosum]
MPADGSGGDAGKNPCCISHVFFEAASKNSGHTAVVHATGGIQWRREAGEGSAAYAVEEGSSPPIYPGDVCFTWGDVLSAVESLSRRIRWVLDGGDDPDLVRPQGSFRSLFFLYYLLAIGGGWLAFSCSRHKGGIVISILHWLCALHATTSYRRLDP